MESTSHLNIFNKGTESFFTPGRQLASIAAVKPDEPALIYISPENRESVTTWRELETLSNRIAWYLIGQGIGPGKSVLAALSNIPTHIALAFGIWKAGACYVPVSNRAPQRNMSEICACVSPALVVTNRRRPAGYPSLSTAELRELCAGLEKAVRGKLCGLALKDGEAALALHTSYQFSNVPPNTDLRNIDGIRKAYVESIGTLKTLLDILKNDL